MARFRGVGLSDGVSFGNIVKISDYNKRVLFEYVDNKEKEKLRVREALAFAEEYQKSLIEKYKSDEEIKDILTSYLYMIKDEELLKKLDKTIDTISCRAEYAIKTEFENIIDYIVSGESEYLKSRGDDIYGIMDKILKVLSGNKAPGAKDLKPNSVITADIVSPIFLAGADISKIVGIITSSESPTSHLTIVANSLKIPMVTCSEDDLKNMFNKQDVIIDGMDGVVITEPSELDKNYYNDLIIKLKEENHKTERFKKLKGQTKDGVKIAVEANICSKEDVDTACMEGAEGVGLVRTEMLFSHLDNVPNIKIKQKFIKKLWKKRQIIMWCSDFLTFQRKKISLIL